MSNRTLFEKRPFGTPEHRLKDIIKMNIQKLIVMLRLDPSDPERVLWQVAINVVIILYKIWGGLLYSYETL
jgi:hypothetical protein